MNRAELLAKIGRALNKADVLDARTQARLLDHVNNRQRQILSAPGCQGLRRREFRFTSIVDQSRYAIPFGENIKHIRDLTNDRELMQRSLPTYRQFNPDPVQNPGTPDGFIQYGFQPVQLQPNDFYPSGTTMFVKSSSAADTTQTVTVESANYVWTATLNGTTPVPLTGVGVVTIDKFFLSALAAGTVTLHAESGIGRQLSIIPLSVTSVLWLVFFLDPRPSQAITYEADMEFLISDLSQNMDVPLIPSDFHDLLETGAILDELAHLDDDRLVVMQRTYDRRLGELKLKLARQGTDRASHGTTSRYGSWAPNSSW